MRYAKVKGLPAMMVLVTLLLPAMGLAQNQMFNGGFERGDTLGWTVFSPGTQTAVFETTSDPALVEEGSHAALLSTTNATDDIVIVHQTVSLQFIPPDSLIRVDGILRGLNATFVDPSVGVRPIVVLYSPENDMQLYSSGNGDFSGDFDAIHFSTTISLPDNPGTAQVQIVLPSGLAEGSILLDGFRLEAVSRSSLDDPVYTDARVEPDAAGVPRLSIDGQAVAPGFFFGNVGSPVIYEEIALAASAGVSLLQVPVNLPWEGTSTAILKRALQENPNAYFLPRVALYGPIHVRDRYADAQYLNENMQQSTATSAVTLASDAYYEELEEQIGILMEVLHNSDVADRIIGYHFSNMETGEWFYPQTSSSFWDYNPINVEGFRDWLRDRHADNIGSLNAAWGSAFGGFSEINLPTPAQWQAGEDGFFRTPQASMHVVEYARYHNNRVADRMSQLAALVKQQSDGRMLKAYFYGYLHELIGNGGSRGMLHSGHAALDRLLDDPNIDILASPFAYFERGIGFPAVLMAPVDSVERAGKIFLQEDDSRTHIWTTPPPSSSLYYPTEWDSIQALRRNLGHVFVRRQAIWWMDLFANGNYNLPSYWEEANRHFMELAAGEIADSTPYRPEIALLVDEESYYWMRSNSYNVHHPALHQIRTQLHQTGAPVGFYMTRDIEHLPDSVKLVILPNLFKANDALISRLDSLKAQQRTLLFLYAPGYVSQGGLSLENMTDLTGFSFARHGLSASTRISLGEGMNALAGGLAGSLSGTTSSLSPRFSVSDAQPGEILGTYQVNGQPAFVWRTHDEWNGVFHGSPYLSSELLRAIALRAGVSIRVDADDVTNQDGISTDGRYLFVYATDSGGPRSFNAPGELIPNGEFDPAVTTFATEGVGRWLSPVIGTLQSTAQEEAGESFARIPAHAGSPSDYVVPLGIRTHARRGASYDVSLRIRISGLNATATEPGNYLYFNIQPDPWASEALTFKIAERENILIPQDTWVELHGEYHHLGSAAHPHDVLLQLQILGGYAFDSIDISRVSLREPGVVPVDIRNVLTDGIVAEGVTHWTGVLSENEQRIYELTPSESGSARVENWLAY